MEEIAKLTKDTFLRDFMQLSPKVNELSEVLWFIFRMGGSAPMNIITARFPRFKDDVNHLVDMKILNLSQIGPDRSLVIFTEVFESKLIRKNLENITLTDISNTLTNNYSQKLGSVYKLDELIDPLATVLSIIIASAKPEQPAFLNKILRQSEIVLKDLPNPLEQSKELLEYYLLKHLRLIKPVGSFGINLSDEAVEVVKKNKVLWEAYSKAKKEAKKVEKKK